MYLPPWIRRLPRPLRKKEEKVRIEIQAKNIDAAAGEILGVLEDTSKGNVVYFGGWHGFGASAALKVVAQRMKSSKSKFDKVIHVDCSVWKSMRALQKAVAEELELPQSVMAIFDWHDEEDDFNGVEQGSRGVIEDIRVKIFRMLVNSTFVVVFHNGSKQCIDLYDCGVPVIPLLKNKMLWTWHGRFRLCTKQWELEDMHGLDNVCLNTSLGYETEELRNLVCEEAEEVAKCLGIAEPDYMNHKVVKLCILYAWAVRRTISPAVVDLNAHAPNYWICDGIIQGQENIVAWEIGDSMQRNLCLDWFGTAINQETIGGDYPEGKNKFIWFEKKILRMANNEYIYSPEVLPFLQNRSMRKILHQLESTTDQLALLLTDLAPEANHWDFTTHQELLKDSTRVLPPEVTSCFIFAQEGPRNTTSITLPVGMFQHSQSSKLRVLHLSQCTFNFASPPFLCCKQLRFLLLDHCTNTASKVQPSHTEDVSCFQKLWVLDLRYTDWYWLLSEKMKILMADLRELNVEGVKLGSISNLCGGRPSLVILRVTDSLVSREDKETNNQAPFPNMSSANGLNDVLPSSLESFSFVTKAGNLAKVSSICFRGCSRLKSIVLRGDLSSLEELDLTGTAVKTLDLRDVVSLSLKRLILLGCEKLCAILWPRTHFYFSSLRVLHINTIRSASPIQAANWEEKDKEASSATSIFGLAARQQDMSRDAAFEFAWHTSLRDARLLRSLATFVEYMYFKIHMVVDSSPASRVSVGGSEVAPGTMSLQQPDRYLYARDVIFQGHQEDGASNKGTASWIWACPPGPIPKETYWYVHIQDEEAMQQQQRSIEGTSTSTALPPSYISNATRMLHVHDRQSITHIPWPQNSFWGSLKWCRVERCPELCSVFAEPQDYIHRIFCKLATFWASQLPRACYIWNWRAMSQFDGQSFWRLAFLHLDYCPRLIHVLPFSVHMATLPSLETLEIVCCGDLREVFPLDPKRQEKQELIKFPKLRRIHLYELPVLQHICGRRMFAPNLETVKIRGCWSLRRLPAVSRNTTNRPKVDCEKDWWDNLEWDGVEANHHPSLYVPKHSRYYKKSHLPRGTVLRPAKPLLRCAASSAAARPASAPRFIQHKKEAFWFYRFLSIVYDHVINPGHWTEDMRDDALEPADLHSRKLKVVDVGGGTGFTTLGIVKHVDKENVILLDQSPHQLEKARQKEALKGVEIMEGDAEDLPFPTDTFDRYVSAGSIEYWPDPQRGIKEAYRVLRLGGKACLIGPVHPTFWLSRFFADMWMLFPTEEEYIEWFKNAGFRDVQLKRIGPKWYRGVRRHGLIMGCSVTGVKRERGDSPLQLGPKAEDVSKPVNPITFFFRFLMGTICAAYYVLVPIYMWIKDQIVPKGQPI